MHIHRIKCGSSNCYIIENGTAGILADTGRQAYADRVISLCRHYHVKLIVLTHGHFDHAENAAEIAGALGIPIGMHENDCDLLASNTNQSLSASTPLGKAVLSASLREFAVRTVPPFQPSLLLHGGERLSDFGIEARILALPGHTNGSIGIDVEGRHLIVGDALMNMFYPTVSMLFHNREEMLESAEKISRLGSRTIYFGHGRPLLNRQWCR